MRFAFLALFVAAGCAKSDGEADLSTRIDAGGPGFATDSGGTPAVPSGLVYGQSATTLYRIDTASHEVKEVGFFNGCGHVDDIALNENSDLYATNGAELFIVENNTGRCTKVASGTFPNSLSFVPAGVLDPAETLVGFTGGTYIKIDIATGATTNVGELGGGFQSSGDVVSVRDGKTYLTVKGPSCADCLVEIDPKTGAMTKNWGPLGVTDAFGLAYWGGELYAFTDAGDVILVTFKDDTLATTKLVVPNAPPDLSFRGAGSATSAPVGPVR